MDLRSIGSLRVSVVGLGCNNFGKQIEHWNGFDLTINARPRQGFVVQGGMSTGRTSLDNCEIRQKLPEITIVGGVVAVPDRNCHSDSDFITQFKLLGTYIVPKIDVQFAATYQATPGPEIQASYFVSPTQVTPQVPLTGGFRLVNVVLPGTEYVRHIKQLDFRVAKILRFGRTRAAINVDLANALNDNYSQAVNFTFGNSWLNPTSIMDARLVKLSGSIEF